MARCRFRGAGIPSCHWQQGHSDVFSRVPRRMRGRFMNVSSGSLRRTFSLVEEVVLGCEDKDRSRSRGRRRGSRLCGGETAGTGEMRTGRRTGRRTGTGTEGTAIVAAIDERHGVHGRLRFSLRIERRRSSLRRALATLTIHSDVKDPSCHAWLARHPEPFAGCCDYGRGMPKAPAEKKGGAGQCRASRHGWNGFQSLRK